MDWIKDKFDKVVKTLYKRKESRNMDFTKFAVGGNTLDEDTIEVLKTLEKRGWDSEFEEIPLPKSFEDKAWGRVFVGEKFVVKSAYTVGEKPRRSCPTEVVHERRRDSASFPNWVVQPKCKPFKDMTREELSKFVGLGVLKELHHGGYIIPEEAGGGQDCHHGNFGMLDDELVQFDW